MKLKVFTRKVVTFCKRPQTMLEKLLQFFSPIFNDKTYLKILFPLKLGYKLELKNPQTYNEKLQWLKLYYRRSIMTKMVDKFEAKKFIEERVGRQYVVKNFGVWNSFNEIDFNNLPNNFVLKTTHDQGGVIICKDKSTFDYKSAQIKLNKHLSKRHFYLTREWPYKNVTPRILAEEYLDSNSIFKDYKFYCFHGVPRVMYVSMGKAAGKMTIDYFDMNFNQLDIRRPNIDNSGKLIDKPRNFDLMINLSRKLSEGFPHLRVDFYELNQKLYVGELTFFQGGGLMPFIPAEWDRNFGNWIDLSQLKQRELQTLEE